MLKTRGEVMYKYLGISLMAISSSAICAPEEWLCTSKSGAHFAESTGANYRSVDMTSPEDILFSLRIDPASGKGVWANFGWEQSFDFDYFYKDSVWAELSAAGQFEFNSATGRFIKTALGYYTEDGYVDQLYPSIVIGTCERL